MNILCVRFVEIQQQIKRAKGKRSNDETIEKLTLDCVITYLNSNFVCISYISLREGKFLCAF